MQRRDFLKAAGCALAAAALPARDARAEHSTHVLGKAHPFDYAWLKGHARALAQQPHDPPPPKLPKALADLGWDAYQAIRLRNDHALWVNDPLRFRAEFFHLGLYFKRPVQMFEVSRGLARELAYDPALFDYGKSGLHPGDLPANLGFAGVRLHYHTDFSRDVAAFLGASYFRAVGGEGQYGLSARGLAINCGMQKPEEFPVFSAYWLERPAPDSSTAVLYALLESPSITGAYRFAITPGDVQVMDIDAALYPRRSIERLGIAPCTSMFLCGENDRRMAYDFRPEIHDSDGLALWNGHGEWVWRPLEDPRRLRVNAFQDEHPKGFGLLQRDRDFADYQDDGVFYDRRPSLWVEPKGDWGRGSVQLVEIPTADETNDNIVAFWNPEQPPKPGQELLYGYRLYWGHPPPAQSPLARVAATRTGLGGVVGKPRTYYSRRFAVDFAGGDLLMLGKRAKIEPDLHVSHGKIELASVRPLDAIGGYRAMFDVRPPDDGTTPIDLRMVLRLGDQALSETWIYQWSPPPAPERTLY